MMSDKTIKIRALIALSMFPLIAFFTHDPVIIFVAGAIAGVSVYFVVWAIQLFIINKYVPIEVDLLFSKHFELSDKKRLQEEINYYFKITTVLIVIACIVIISMIISSISKLTY